MRLTSAIRLPDILGYTFPENGTTIAKVLFFFKLVVPGTEGTGMSVQFFHNLKRPTPCLGDFGTS